jgi:hypothetical protein
MQWCTGIVIGVIDATLNKSEEFTLKTSFYQLRLVPFAPLDDGMNVAEPSDKKPHFPVHFELSRALFASTHHRRWRAARGTGPLSVIRRSFDRE